MFDSWCWRPMFEQMEAYGMGADNIQYQHHRFLPITRFRPRTIALRNRDAPWRWKWMRTPKEAADG